MFFHFLTLQVYAAIAFLPLIVFLRPELGLDKFIDTEGTSILCIFAGALGVYNSAIKLKRVRDSFHPDRPVVYMRITHKSYVPNEI